MIDNLDIINAVCLAWDCDWQKPSDRNLDYALFRGDSLICFIAVLRRYVKAEDCEAVFLDMHKVQSAKRLAECAPHALSFLVVRFDDGLKFTDIRMEKHKYETVEFLGTMPCAKIPIELFQTFKEAP